MPANPLKIDPSRTLTLRKRFVADMNRRFREVMKAIKSLVVDDDVFGLKPRVPLQFNIAKQAWKFETDARKVELFREWLQEQVDANILVADPSGKPWMSEYIDSGYKKGIRRTYSDLRPELAEQAVGGIDDPRSPLFPSISGPEETKRLQAIYTRAFNDLKGVTDTMSQKLSRSLSLGLSQGESPIAIAGAMVREVDKLKRTRAEMIARTEVIAAHADGQLDVYEKLQIPGVSIQSEWVTASDERVCEMCGAMEGAIIPTAEARNLIPRHPNCVLGDSVIQSSDVLCMMKGHYTGKIFEFVTAKGRRFSVTENHVLLTNRGFLHAKDILQSDSFIEAMGQQRKCVVSIAECFTDFLKTDCMAQRGVGLLPENLHGDGKSFDSGILITLPNGKAQEKMKAGKKISVNQLRFDAIRADGCPEEAEYLMALSILARGKSHAGIKVFLRDNSFVMDQIKEINISDAVSVPVYDVSTKSTLYNLNGILSSNCRCVFVPAVNQPVNRTEVTEQIERSILAERVKPRTLKKAVDTSTWAGKKGL